MTIEKVFIQIDNERIELVGKDLEEFQAARLEYSNAIKAKEAEQATARQAVLDRLGITAEEAQLILGGNN